MTSAYELYIAEPFTGSSHSWAKSILKDLPVDSSVLDVGPGSGVMAEYLSSIGVKNCYAVEIDPITREKLKNQYIAISDQLTNFNNHKFDRVLLLDVIEHMAEPETFLNDLKPFLKPDARILISVPNIVHWPLRILFLLGYFDYHQFGPLDKTHLRFFSKGSLNKMLGRANYKIVSSSASVIPLERILPEQVYSNKIYQKLTEFRLFFAKLFPQLFGFQLLVEVKL